MKMMMKKTGRPSKKQSETEPSAREKILETALELFTQHGVNNVGVDRIIKEANVAKMTFFKHFPSKKDLIISFLELRDQRSLEQIKAGVDQITKDKSKKLAAFIEVMNHWLLLPSFSGCAFINRTAELAEGDIDEKQLCLEHKKKLAGFIEEMARDASLKDPAAFAMQLVVVLDGSTVQGQMNSSEAAKQLFSETAKILLKYYQM